MESTPSSRKALAARRQRTRATIVSAVATLALTGLIVGAASSAQTSWASEARIATTTELSQSTGLRHDQLAVQHQAAKAHADGRAKNTLRDATVVMASTRDRVDVGNLTASVTSLANYEALNLDAVISLTGQTRTIAATVQAAAVEVDRTAAAATAAAADAAASALSAANTPDGARATARDLAASRYGWGESQFSCLAQLWAKESGWSYTALNESSGATGIPQALPGSKMALVGSDWQTNASTQIRWGLDYISRGYGTPCSAWSHSQAMDWY
ncbi:hypothetical protein E3O19_08365 [Cryobacterium algoritolerans]|uniref:Phospholipase n=1 Tax=Cryobacterium algoritolerans TaxID=1259184 RepID=A0A4R8WT59_9MICO|nr:hypothetical protein [Cryobacterium algoritolerans]TFC15697.1 hypothetical protein E3O19_08365 [Cryobacterium algoritolerans]